MIVDPSSSYQVVAVDYFAVDFVVELTSSNYCYFANLHPSSTQRQIASTTPAEQPLTFF